MKKLMIAAAIVCAAVVSQAAAVDWKATAAKADLGATVYILTTSQATWEKASDVAAAAIGSGSVESLSGGRSYAASGTAASSAITKSTTALSVVVVSADGTKYATTSMSPSGCVYDPSANPPESSPGTASFSVSGLTYKAFAVPEPTSGLRLLLGVAGMALRRRRA